jgi:signal recognition particle GTPase
MDLEASMKGAQRLMQGTFTLEDMMDQLNQVRNSDRFPVCLNDAGSKSVGSADQ